MRQSVASPSRNVAQSHFNARRRLAAKAPARVADSDWAVQSLAGRWPYAPYAPLAISEPDDAAEQDAERVARQVMRGQPSTPGILALGTAPRSIQRACSCGEKDG